jgi:hypothetical protein
VIHEAEIEKALEWLVKNATPAAQARANRVYVEEYSKPLRAMLMKKSGEQSIGGQEREAYAHPDYIAHLEALKVAVEEDEKMRWLQKTAEAKIECWRSEQANMRAQGKVA